MFQQALPNYGISIPILDTRVFNRRTDQVTCITGDILTIPIGSATLGLVEGDEASVWSNGVRPGDAGSPAGVQLWGFYCVCLEPIAFGAPGRVRFRGLCTAVRVGSVGDTVAAVKGSPLFARPARASLSAGTTTFVGSKILGIAVTASTQAATSPDNIQAVIEGIIGHGAMA